MSVLAALLLCVAPARAAGSDPVEGRMAAVMDLFYGLRFDEARAAAKAVRVESPGHPAGPFYEAVVAYQELLVDDARSTAALAEVERGFGEAERAAAAWASSAPATAEYFQGAAHGFRARALFAAKGQMAAVGEARKAVRHLKRALALDPSREDAYLGLGMYEYYVGLAPALARPFAYALVGVWGNKDRGLSYIRRAADSDGPARFEARAALAAIDASDREAHWDEADALLKELVERYPGNPLYRLRRAYVTLRRGAWGETAKAADPDGPWLAAVPDRLRGRARAAALYRAAEGELLAGRSDAAAVFLSKLEGLELPDGLGPWVQRRKGQTLLQKAPGPEVWPQVWPLSGAPD